MWTGMALLAGLAAVVGGTLVWVAHRLPPGSDDASIEALNALLPQTQCGQCGYPGCRPYAAALVAGAAGPDRCPPGGPATAQVLARALGTITPVPATTTRELPARLAVAFIHEEACIGCARCLEVCPVDAIVGAHRFLHTVIAGECTGCELCVPACPVDCISLLQAGGPP